MVHTIKSRALLYRSFGDPKKVLELTTVDVEAEPDDGKVLIQWLASPINPLDINKIQGVYFMQPDLPVIGGSEGIGRVVKVGRGTKLAVGDHVTLFATTSSFWTEFGVEDECDLIKIDKRVPLAVAATLMVNPTTAWVMLKEYVQLAPDDYVIQNSANSGVGRAVIELCKAFGYKSVNVVRDRPDIDALKTELWKLGADHVFTEEEFAQGGRKFIRTLSSPPKLALNGVGGRSVLAISSVLAHGGTCITYGGMSKKPHEFSTSALVFNDIKAIGVAIGLWMRAPENQATTQRLLGELQELAIAGKLTAPPMDEMPLEEFVEAVNRSTKGRHHKQLFIVSNSNTSSKI